MIKRLLVLSLVFLSTAQAADSSKEVRTLESYRVEKAPVLDGRLDDPAWQQAKRTGDFKLRGGKGLSKAKTEVMTCWDTENLYIAYICYEPNMDKLVEHYLGYEGPYNRSGGVDGIQFLIRKY